MVMDEALKYHRETGDFAEGIADGVVADISHNAFLWGVLILSKL